MLGERIKKLRVERGLSQSELAFQIGVSKQTASNWENDNIMPSVDTLLKLADFFGVTTDYLLDRDDRHYLEITNLTDTQLAHVQQIVDDIAGRNTSKRRRCAD